MVWDLCCGILVAQKPRAALKTMGPKFSRSAVPTEFRTPTCRARCARCDGRKNKKGTELVLELEQISFTDLGEPEGRLSAKTASRICCRATPAPKGHRETSVRLREHQDGPAATSWGSRRLAEYRERRAMSSCCPNRGRKASTAGRLCGRD